LRTGGLISDWLGEIRLAEGELFEHEFFRSSRLITWKGGRFELGYPLGMPLGVEAGVSFQVYSGGGFLCATGEPQASVPARPGELSWFEVIGVATHLKGLEQSNVIEKSLGRKVELEWPGSVSADVEAYRVYHDSRSGTVDYGTVTDEVEAKPGGVALTGYGWTSDELGSGTWKFGLRTVDGAGNVRTSPVREVAVSITPTPDPPGGLGHTYDGASHKATLTWTGPQRWA
jgi:hypothetical protein